MRLLKSKPLLLTAFLFLTLIILEAQSATKIQLRVPATLETLEDAKKIFVELGGSPQDKPVIAFVTSWCPYCKSLETFLKENNIPYVHADIEKDAKAARYYEELTKYKEPGIPKTLVGTHMIDGFNPQGILDIWKGIDGGSGRKRDVV